MAKSKNLPSEFDDLGGISPDLKAGLADLNTDSAWRTFGIYRAITKREHLNQFLTQSRLELRKFLEDESGNQSDPLTVQRIENFWSTLLLVENGPRAVRAPLPLLAIAFVLLLATLGTGIWYLVTQRDPSPETTAIPGVILETAAAPMIPKKNMDIESLNAQLNDLNAQFSNLVSSLAEIPEAGEELSKEPEASASEEMNSLEKEWDANFTKFVSKLKEFHSEIAENPNESFPKSLEAFSQTTFSMESRTRILQVSSHLLNQLSTTTSTPDIILEDSEADPASP